MIWKSKRVKNQIKLIFDGFLSKLFVNLWNFFVFDFFLFCLENLQGVAGFPVVDAAAEFEIERERKIIILFNFDLYHDENVWEDFCDSWKKLKFKFEKFVYFF